MNSLAQTFCLQSQKSIKVEARCADGLYRKRTIPLILCITFRHQRPPSMIAQYACAINAPTSY